MRGASGAATPHSARHPVLAFPPMLSPALLLRLEQKMREIKRQQHRQIREQAHAEAMAAKKQTIMASPRPGVWCTMH